MAIIDPEGLFGGDRMAALSDKARLYWPWLYSACNSYARIEFNPRAIIRRCFAAFTEPMTEQQLIFILSEYAENYLLFAYERDGQQWIQFATSEKFLPRHKTKKDLASPNPTSDERKAFDDGYLAWKKAKSFSLHHSRKSSETRELFPGNVRGIGIGIGVGVGVGVGKDSPKPESETKALPAETMPSSGETIPGNPEPKANPIREITERAFEVYCAMFNRNPKQYSLTPQRRDKAEARIRERMKIHLGNAEASERDVGKALENLQASEYHVANGYVDWIDQVFRSTEEFEKRLNWMPKTGGSNGNGNHRTKSDATLSALQRSIQKGRDQDGIGQARSAPPSDYRGSGVRGFLG